MHEIDEICPQTLCAICKERACNRAVKHRDEIESTLHFTFCLNLEKNGRFQVFAGRPGEKRKNQSLPVKPGEWTVLTLH